MRRVAMFGLVLLVSLGAACGDGDGEDPPGASASPDAEDTDDAAAAAGDLLRGECGDAYAAFIGSMSAIGAARGGSPEEVEELASSLEAWADDAPREIRDDVRVVSAAVASFYRVLQESGYDPSSGKEPTASQAAAFAEAAESVDRSAVEEASESIGAYFEEHCGARMPGAGGE